MKSMYVRFLCKNLCVRTIRKTVTVQGGERQRKNDKKNEDGLLRIETQGGHTFGILITSDEKN